MTRNRRTRKGSAAQEAATAGAGPRWPEVVVALAMLAGASGFAGAEEASRPAQPSELSQLQALEAENVALKRRLAQAVQIEERLAATAGDFAELAGRLQAVEALAQTLKAERAASQRQLQELSRQIRALQAERAALRAELTATTQQAASLRAQLAAARTDAQKDQVRLAEAQRQVAEAVSRSDMLQAELDQMRSQLRATPPPAVGRPQRGTISGEESGPGGKSGQSTERLDVAESPQDLGQAKARAAEFSKKYRQLMEETRGRPTAAQAAQLELTRSRLAAAQSLVARLRGARGVYAVRPGDTLSAIAAKSYGDGLRWQEVLDANRYLLDDPDHIVPGMVLVVP